MEPTYLIQSAKLKSKYETKQIVTGSFNQAKEAYDALTIQSGEKKRLIKDQENKAIYRHTSNGAAIIPMN